MISLLVTLQEELDFLLEDGECKRKVMERLEIHKIEVEKRMARGRLYLYSD